MLLSVSYIRSKTMVSSYSIQYICILELPTLGRGYGEGGFIQLLSNEYCISLSFNRFIKTIHGPQLPVPGASSIPLCTRSQPALYPSEPSPGSGTWTMLRLENCVSSCKENSFLSLYTFCTVEYINTVYLYSAFELLTYLLPILYDFLPA